MPMNDQPGLEPNQSKKQSKKSVSPASSFGAGSVGADYNTVNPESFNQNTMEPERTMSQADRAKDEATNSVEQNAKQALDESKQALKNAGQQIKESMSNAYDQARSATDRAGTEAERMAREAASAVSRKTEQAAGSMGSSMESLANTIRAKAPASGAIGSAATTVANKLDSAGEYLQSQGLSGLAQDFGDFIRDHPVPSVLVGLGVGALIGRALQR